MQNRRRTLKLTLLGLFVIAGSPMLVDGLTPEIWDAKARPHSDSRPASLPSPDARQQPAPGKPPPAEDFVGSNTCRACHPAEYTFYARTAHFATIGSPKYLPPDQGCEMCHGPGRQHVQAKGKGHIFNPRKVSARDVVAMCTRCHREQRVGKCGFHENQHNVDVVACNDCHHPHQEVTHGYMLRREPPGLCYTCHREIRAEFSRPFHHKVPEGGMTCRDCHQQHGSFNLTETVDTVGGPSAICLRCHTDKEGPFVFEHITLRTDRCLACHVPHGSINNRLLVRSQVRLLCQECHAARLGAVSDNPQGFHDLTLTRFQNCTNCHAMIHGSNTSRLFFR